MVIEIEVQGSLVQSNVVLLARLTGSERVPDAMIQVASCKNARDWSRDQTLGDSVVVNTNSSVIRAAELAASGRFDSRVVLAVEQSYWSGGDLVFDQSMAEQRFDREQVNSYIQARATPPSVAAKARFVIYATAVTTSVQAVTYVDTTTLPRTAWRRGTGTTHHVALTLAGGASQAGDVRDDQCSNG